MPLRFALLVASCVVFVGGCGSKPTVTHTPPVVTASGPVTIEVVVGDETKSFTVDDIANGTTLESVLRESTEIPIELSGSGLTAFVNSIDGVATNQSEGWTYRIDGNHANVGIGSFELHPPTTVTWRFGSWDEMPESE